MCFDSINYSTIFLVKLQGTLLAQRILKSWNAFIERTFQEYDSKTVLSIAYGLPAFEPDGWIQKRGSPFNSLSNNC